MVYHICSSPCELIVGQWKTKLIVNPLFIFDLQMVVNVISKVWCIYKTLFWWLNTNTIFYKKTMKSFKCFPNILIYPSYWWVMLRDVKIVYWHPYLRGYEHWLISFIAITQCSVAWIINETNAANKRSI